MKQDINRISPVILGAIEKKIVEGVLRLSEAHRILNHLKREMGYECIPLEALAPPWDDDEDDDDDDDDEEEAAAESKTSCSLECGS